ncbi:MAG: IS256 family transposase [Vicinamibacterales bacterium]
MKRRIRQELLDELLADYKGPDDLTGPEGLLKQLTGALVERALAAELTDHLGHAPGAPAVSGNARNGTSPKTLTTDQGDVPIEVPRDRNGTFEPQLVKKHQRRFTGFDDKILSMYARGMSVRDIQAHLSELYGTDISPSLISTVTDAVVDEVTKWQARPLDAIWPIVYLDAIVLKVRDQGVVQNKHVYMALGINVEGKKEVLGLWIEPNEGARFWLKVITELKNRGVQDVFVMCCDGLKGFPEAIEAVFPRTIVQTCIVHLIRSSTRFVAWVNRKALIGDLRRVYAAETEDAALAALAEFEKKWAERYPMVAQSWRSNWERVRPFFAFARDVRRIIYTTNAIESLNFSLRKVTKARGHFPNDEAALKLVYLAIRNMEKKWTRQPQYWNLALNQFAIMFEGRLPA